MTLLKRASREVRRHPQEETSSPGLVTQPPRRSRLTGSSGIFLQVQFFSELQFCHPLARFVFEATEAVHTFLSYHHSRAMTAGDLDEALNKCNNSHRRASESGTLNLHAGPDVLLAMYSLPPTPRPPHGLRS